MIEVKMNNFANIKRSSALVVEIMSHYIKNATHKKQTIHDKVMQLKVLAQVLANYGGILAKVSQLLFMEHIDSELFDECKPYSRDKTHADFVKLLAETDTFNNIIVDTSIYKSGSVGQLYKGVCNTPDEKTEVVIKTQYTGLRLQFDHDLTLLKLVSKYLYSFVSAEVEKEIIKQIYDELDYDLELKNQKEHKDMWETNENIIIPRVFEKLSSNTIMVSEFIDGLSLSVFNSQSTPDEKNNIGKLLCEFIFTGIFKHKRFYSDIHYGNFLVKNKSKLCIMDFGSIVELDNVIVKDLINLYYSMLNENKELFYQTISEIGIATEFKDGNAKEYIYEFFRHQFEPLVNPSFRFTEEWLDIVNTKNEHYTDDWLLPPKYTLFNRIYHGLYAILTKLEIETNLCAIMKDIVEEAANENI